MRKARSIFFCSKGSNESESVIDIKLKNHHNLISFSKNDVILHGPIQILDRKQVGWHSLFKPDQGHEIAERGQHRHSQTNKILAT